MSHSLIWLQSVFGIIVNNYYIATIVSNERSPKTGTDPVPEIWCVKFQYNTTVADHFSIAVY
jgi:hypothetical protein